jgi:hypothetical protein
MKKLYRRCVIIMRSYKEPIHHEVLTYELAWTFGLSEQTAKRIYDYWQANH